MSDLETLITDLKNDTIRLERRKLSIRRDHDLGKIDSDAKNELLKECDDGIAENKRNIEYYECMRNEQKIGHSDLDDKRELGEEIEGEMGTSIETGRWIMLSTCLTDLTTDDLYGMFKILTLGKHQTSPRVRKVLVDRIVGILDSDNKGLTTIRLFAKTMNLDNLQACIAGFLNEESG